MTAQDFLKIKEPNSFIIPQEWLIEFTEYHVKLALEAAYNNAEMDLIKFTDDWEINKDSILNAYPLENIK